MNDAQFDFGMVGLGVMGSNLLLNMADHGFAVLGYDTNKEKTHLLERDAPQGTNMKGVNTIKELVVNLKVPRKIMLLVPAGKPVDIVIDNLCEFLEAGDIVIDGGNSHYTDTIRRIKSLQPKGINFMGVGISGGEEGARTGPSIMPGGVKEAYEYLRPLFEAIAAKVDGVPCVDFLGNQGAGHFVKMVHNGIEYSIMQLICESYDLLKQLGGLDNEELHNVYKRWNNEDLQSFLVQITARIFTKLDDKTGNYLVDMILDKAGSKGTGKWTSQDALDLGVPIPSIDAAVTMRNISALNEQRLAAATLYPKNKREIYSDKEALIEYVHDALFFGILMSYTQGLAMLQVASKDLEMDIPLNKVVNVWKGGCIIRSTLLNVFDDVFEENKNLENLLLHKSLVPLVTKCLPGTRKVIALAVENGLPVGGLMASINYFDASTSAKLPINLLQAQRDFFGAHTYARTDEPGIFHTNWQQQEETV